MVGTLRPAPTHWGVPLHQADTLWSTAKPGVVMWEIVDFLE